MNFKTTVIPMLRALKEKADDVQEKEDKVSREMEILRQNQKNAKNHKHCHRNEEYL